MSHNHNLWCTQWLICISTTPITVYTSLHLYAMQIMYNTVHTYKETCPNACNTFQYVVYLQLQTGLAPADRIFCYVPVKESF